MRSWTRRWTSKQQGRHTNTKTKGDLLVPFLLKLAQRGLRFRILGCVVYGYTRYAVHIIRFRRSKIVYPYSLNYMCRIILCRFFLWMCLNCSTFVVNGFACCICLNWQLSIHDASVHSGQDHFKIAYQSAGLRLTKSMAIAKLWNF
jgi:hypothetical protein